MKFLFFFLSSFFFSFFCTYSATTPSPTIVFDTTGEPLKVGEKYYVLRKPTTLNLGAFGGLKLSDYSNQGCADVVTQASPSELGIPVSFHPLQGSDIRLSQSLNIRFETSKPACASSTVWQVGKTDPVSQLPLITIGGALGNPSCANGGNWFKIEEGSIPNTYRFVTHPDEFCNLATVTHGIIIRPGSNGQKVLVRSNRDDKYNVIFAKAPPP
ncbi:21 kDa seed protein-like [Andrographis paniculata]|uniref:21 kDa seed protein-like n=1 Tax=Andrographis paniculata TaxID=175694 RepID=UPI0021E97DFB|nr:21 kDa seed protein-like [Andrographis paniculata]